MLAYSVATISRNSGYRIARRVIRARSRALVRWPRASKPTGFSKWVSFNPSLSASRFMSSAKARTLVSPPPPRCSARAQAAASPEEIMVAINSSLTLKVSPATRPTLL
jgi:hypothetical protein